MLSVAVVTAILYLVLGLGVLHNPYLKGALYSRARRENWMLSRRDLDLLLFLTGQFGLRLTTALGGGLVFHLWSLYQ